MQNQDEKSNEYSHPRDHLANERTFLAWIRTSIGIMAFGFVVEKFAIFIKQIALLLGKENLPNLPSISTSSLGYSSLFGVSLVAFGALITLFAYIKYKKVEKDIEDNIYRPTSLLNIILTIFILATGIFLIIYLKNSF